MLSLTVIVSALWKIGLGNNEAWAAVAAALAVLTSVISSWAAQRTVELQEDSQKPYPIDVSSRYLLLQLRVINFGGSAAHDKVLEKLASEVEKLRKRLDESDPPCSP